MQEEIKTTAVQKTVDHQKQILKWQNKLLPWLIIMPTLLVLLFVYLATQQVNQFNKALDVKKQSVYETLLPTDSAELRKIKSNMEYVKWMSLTKMEEESLERRHHQGGMLLLSRVFMKYLGFLTGMIMAIVGSVFIIGKLSEDVSKFEGTAGQKIRFSLMSSSPGIIFAVLGTLLMTATILEHRDIVVEDTPLYLNAYGISSLKEEQKENSGSVKPRQEIDTSKVNELFKTSH
jgi:hypothetical protein